ncbi:MAG: DHH family phosphoesterase [Candidatus Omnitrophica bacterium]|nr:DHH family phosphoesterase [Candidatus Omnitrophota bacterium]
MERLRHRALLSFIARRGRDLSPLLILTHDHPDPDAIASAWALAHLLERLAGVRSRIVYGGIIGRMENQLLVRLLRIPLSPVKPQDFERYRRVAVVDTQPPFQNNRLPARHRPAIILDHHRRNPRTHAECAIIDPAAGATTTLLVEALQAARAPIPPRLATALVYGIISETQHLGREAGPRDVAAYRACFPRASIAALSKIQNPPRPPSFFHVLERAIRHAFTAGRVIGVHLGPVPSQDIVAHMADFLLTHEQMRWSIVTGRYDGRLFISLRTRNPRAEAGRLLWRLLGRTTRAGGHSMIAGGSIEVGAEASEAAWRAAERELAAAFLRSQGRREPLALHHPFQPAVREGRR